MNDNTVTTEVLVFTGTRFSKKEFSETKKPAIESNEKKDSEKIYWTELLSGMLYNLLGLTYEGKNFVWQVIPADHFMRICIGPAPAFPGNQYCLDPYSFLDHASNN